MSFGFGISDFITIYQLTEKLCMSFKNAPNEFSDISRQLESLGIVLSNLKAQAEDPNSLLHRQDAVKKLELGVLQKNLVATMEELEGIHKKYQQTGKFRSRLSLGQKDLAPVRSKLNNQISTISTFVVVMNMETLGRVEPMIERIIVMLDERARRDLEQAQTILSAAMEDEEDLEDGASWALLEVELISEGIPLDFIQENKKRITEALRNIVQLNNLDGIDRKTIYADDSMSQVGQSPKTQAKNSYLSGTLLTKLPILRTWAATRRILPYQEWLQTLSSTENAVRIKLLNHGFNIQEFGPTNPSGLPVFKGLPKYNQLQETAVCWAATKGDKIAVQMLLDRGCSPSSKLRGENAILLAAKAGNWDIVTLLLKAGADVHTRYTSTSSHIGLIQTVAAANQCDILVQILRKGVKPDMQCKRIDESTACRMGDKEVDISWTGLHLAARNCCLEAAGHLISKGADVNRKTAFSSSPLSLAITSSILSTKTSDTTVTNPQELALIQRHQSLISLLLKNGANIDDRCRYSKDSLNPSLARFISLNVQYRLYLSPLHMAVISQQLALVKFLLDSGSDVNHRLKSVSRINPNDSWETSTPLHLAVMDSQYKIVKLLLNSGSDIETDSRWGDKETALHSAVKQNQYKITKLLVDFGAPLDVRNSAGETPRALAKNSTRQIQKLFANK